MMFRLLLTLVCVFVLLLGCSNHSKEQEAKQALDKAESQAQSLAFEQSLALYQSVIDAYPQTPQAETARQAINRLQRQRDEQFKSDAAKVLERMSTVLDGYQAFAGTLPLNLQDLDAGGYMFDSQYLAEILPAGAQVYLTLNAEKLGTQMWFQQAGQAQIFQRSLANDLLNDVSPAEFDALKSKWQKLAKVGGLTQVKL